MKDKNHLPVKKNNASIQVMKTLRFLMHGRYTMKQIVEGLNKQEKEAVFNSSVVSKYINTCRFCGIKIPRIHNKYFVASIPFGMNIMDKDIELIQELQTTAKNKMSNRANKEFTKFIETLSTYSNKEIIALDTETTDITREIFEKAVINERKICILFRNKTSLICTPVGIIEHNGQLFFNVIYDNLEKLIPVKKVSALEILNEKIKVSNREDSVVYNIKGDLAKRYNLRQNESSISENLTNNCISISNRGENLEILLSRLMRYDVLCEVQKPSFARNNIKKIIEDTLANYEKNNEVN